MTADELGTSLAVRASQYAWLFGAGASAAANVPTAQNMIVDFKARLFCAAVGIPRREIDPVDPIWLERIETYFASTDGLPPAGHPDEYAAAFEAILPEEDERRIYIEQAVRQGSPSFGHRVLAALIASGQAPCLFTTNFDPLIERAATVADELLAVDRRVHLAVAALDSADRADRCVRESSWPLLVKLHGDYQSVRLKNTSAELRSQDGVLRQALIAAANRFGLIVVGYSGRDMSVMDSLREALRGPSPYPAGIRWVVRGSGGPLPAVSDFLESASAAGVDARFVDSETFDELAAAIDRHVTLPEQVATHVRDSRPVPILQPVVLPTSNGSPFPALRCSALPLLAVPSRARRLRVTQSMTTPQAREVLKAAGVRGAVIARGHELTAFGADEDLLTAFTPYGGTLDGEVELSPALASSDLGLLYDALVRALTRGRPLRPMLRSNGHSIVVASNSSTEQAREDRERLAPLQRAYSDALTGTVPGTTLPFAEGVRIRLECHGDQWWCVFDPFTWIDLPRLDRDLGDDGQQTHLVVPSRRSDPAGDWRKERWARRYNPKWSSILDAWSGLLVSGQQDTVAAMGLRDRVGIDAAFTISGTTAWSRPARATAAGT